MNIIPFNLPIKIKPKTSRMTYEIIQRNRSPQKPLVSIITPIFNNEKTIHQTVQSVLNQSIGHDYLEYILIDDGSTDSTRNILTKYAKEFPSITLAFLKSNTGNPAFPRNLGMKLATAPYLTFLDADDWLEKTGLEKLYSVLEETGDDYVVGRTIKMGMKQPKVMAEHESCIDRRSISPISIPHIFHHLGPRARMIKSSIVKKHNLAFPEMKYAEDKQFFIDYLLHAKKISTTTSTIYYLNRLDDNEHSLTKQTNVLKKMHCNMKVIHYFHQKKIDPQLKQMVMNRLYEFDCFNQFMHRYYTLRSDAPSYLERTKDLLKQIAYIRTFRKILKTTAKLNDDIANYVSEPINHICYELFQKKQYKKIEELFKWHKEEKIKQYVMKANKPYMITPLMEPYHLIPVPMYAELIEAHALDNKFYLHIKIAGDFLDTPAELLFRDQKNFNNEFVFKLPPYPIGGLAVELPISWLHAFNSSVYSVFFRYREYQKIHIAVPSTKMKASCKNKKNFYFYTTTHQHLALKVQ
ncbi:glycosyltransferase family 2 protein [Niallia sp. NCCP-28]|uniref:glycosyltransferase family 2 protein n=1 Tax=Niallia sp. NCCP-28 TaxID=2934712 RepID=UPI002080ABD7|nr:glycosyltransferase family 2 protein [Niallia sp. NCCP-28]GKU81877.1 glycosyl transferase family 2 [Niallia sp. NCCP-28]